MQQVPRGTGTGFVWDDRGYIVTNFHVVQEASGARVTLADQTSFKAQLVGVFPDRDIAVLKIDAPKNKLPPLAIGTSKDLVVGQKVYAIGNPFGLDQTLTTGIVSALNREIDSVTQRTIRGVMQTDAAINPGNSGGPLLDSAGRVIGVNTAICSPSGASAGIGFAIPVDEVNRIVPRLIRDGRMVRPAHRRGRRARGDGARARPAEGRAAGAGDARQPGAQGRAAAVHARQRRRHRAGRRDHRDQRRAGGRLDSMLTRARALPAGRQGHADACGGRARRASRR